MGAVDDAERRAAGHRGTGCDTARRPHGLVLGADPVRVLQYFRALWLAYQTLL